MPIRAWNTTRAAVQRHPRLTALAIVVVLLVVLGSAYAVHASTAEAAYQQPIAFNHEVMVQAGIPCLFCHTGATQSAVAGIPSVDRCMGCHRTIATDNPEVQKVAAYWQAQKPIPWVRVNRLPRFVYFSHAVHVTVAGLNCETCHGDVGHMTVVKPTAQFTMGFCLGCHEKQPNAPQLIECITCHK
ncbi:MAG: cytochrome c family protein [Chloroflexi bacterium]|nr:cytochrome c family protein [Chloroflexota bacterium]